MKLNCDDQTVPWQHSVAIAAKRGRRGIIKPNIGKQHYVVNTPDVI